MRLRPTLRDEAPSGGMDTLLGQRNLAGLAADDSGDPLESRSFKLHFGNGFPAFGGPFTSTPEFDVGTSNDLREHGLGWRLDLVKRGASELGFCPGDDAQRSGERQCRCGTEARGRIQHRGAPCRRRIARHPAGRRVAPVGRNRESGRTPLATVTGRCGRQAGGT